MDSSENREIPLNQIFKRKKKKKEVEATLSDVKATLSDVEATLSDHEKFLK